MRDWAAFGARDIRTEPVELHAWEEGETRLEVLAPSAFECPAIQAVHSAADVAEGDLVDAGGLAPEDFLRFGDSARGGILLLRGHVFSGGQFEPIQKRISLAESAGAAAIVLRGTDPDLPSIQYLNRSRIPVTGISHTEADRLLELAAQDTVRVRIKTGGRTEAKICRNVWAELKSPQVNDDIIIACAHLDGFHIAPAAMDNLSGVVTMTEIARQLAPYQEHFKRTLRFIAFTGEELGYAGSKQYVREHAAELDRTRFLFSMDCIFENTARGTAVMWSPEMREYIHGSLHEAHPEVDVRDFFCMSSDYLPFMLAGIPAGRPADWHNTFPRWTHTVEDTDDKISYAWLRDNAIAYARMLLWMLTDNRPLPSRRQSAAEVQSAIEQAGAGEALRWQVLLPS